MTTLNLGFLICPVTWLLAAPRPRDQHAAHAQDVRVAAMSQEGTEAPPRGVRPAWQVWEMRTIVPRGTNGNWEGSRKRMGSGIPVPGNLISLHQGVLASGKEPASQAGRRGTIHEMLTASPPPTPKLSRATAPSAQAPRGLGGPGSSQSLSSPSGDVLCSLCSVAWALLAAGADRVPSPEEGQTLWSPPPTLHDTSDSGDGHGG